MNDVELVKVYHSKHDLGELGVINEREKSREDVASGLTSRKRFFSGLFFAYSITFPLGIHSVIMRKRCGSVDTDAPNKGKMFGWDKCFQPTISRHNR